MPLLASASPSTSKVLLCTSQGYQWVDVATDTKSEPTDEHCIYCVLSDSFDDQVAFAVESWYLGFVKPQSPFVEIGNKLPKLATALTRPRSPPLFI